MKKEVLNSRLISNPANQGNLESLSRNLEAIQVYVNKVAQRHSIPFSDVLQLIEKEESRREMQVPSFILRDRNLGILESVSKYMKEEHNLTYHKIAVILRRDDRVIWVTYNRAIRKRLARFTQTGPSKFLPISLFTSDILAPLESISWYMIEKLRLDPNSAAMLLNRHEKSIQVSYSKAKKKLNGRGNDRRE